MGVLTSTSRLPLLANYPAFVRRHGLLIGALMGVGLAAGLAWSVQQPREFSATASVALAPVPVYVAPTTTELVPPEVSIDTDAQLLHSPRVLRAIGEALGTDADTAAEHLSVTASPNTHVLHVTVTARTASLAAQGANAAVEVFIDVRRNALGALAEDQLRLLRLLVGDRVEGSDVGDEGDDALVIPATDELFDQVLAARASLDELEEARREPAEVVRPAVAPRHADYANTEVPLTSGAMLGLLAACLMAAGRDRFRSPGNSRTAPPAKGHQSSRLPGTTGHHKGYEHAI